MAKILALVLLFALSPALAEESCEVAGNCAEALDFDDVGLLQVKAAGPAQQWDTKTSKICQGDWLHDKTLSECKASCMASSSCMAITFGTSVGSTGSVTTCVLCTSSTLGPSTWATTYVKQGNPGEECWTSQGCHSEGSSPCTWCGGQDWFCCSATKTYASGDNCHNAQFFSQASSHRCAKKTSGECPGGWKKGDGTGGTETYVGSASSQFDCIKLVKGKCSACNGATFGPKHSACYGEMDMTGTNNAAAFQTCKFD